MQQGGVDCRYLITHLTQRSFTVLSLTTIATPHRGSTFASHFLSLASTRLPAVLTLLELLPNGSGDGKAFECLTPEAMEKFNKNTPDMDDVRYFSWGAEYEPVLFDTWRWAYLLWPRCTFPLIRIGTPIPLYMRRRDRTMGSFQ